MPSQSSISLGDRPQGGKMSAGQSLLTVLPDSVAPLGTGRSGNRVVRIKNPGTALLLADLVAVLISQMLAWQIRLGEFPGLSGLMFNQAILLGAFAAANYLLGLYKTNEKDLVAIVIETAMACSAAGIAGAVAHYVLGGIDLGRSILGITIFSLFVISSTTRTLLASRRVRTAHHDRVLFVGHPLEATDLLETMRRMRETSLVGFLSSDDDTASPVPCLGTSADLEQRVRMLRPTCIVFGGRYEQLDESTKWQLVRYRFAGVTVTDLANFYQSLCGATPLSCLDEHWLLGAQGFNLLADSRKQRVKRLTDCLLATVGLIVSSPLMLLAAIAIRLTSPGPVLFRQRRAGLREKPFELLKFRSMVHSPKRDPEEGRWAEAEDERVTAVGRVIRKTRLDELPQLWNVLKGEMSFVGPRPEQVPIVERLRRITPFYGFRHAVRPGITGWAQINNGYCATEEDSLRKLEYDLYYVQHISVLLDLQILFRTVSVVLTAKGSR
jgi:exopolysaccharide biosynthesis polyprenyl glycosylphosphotransferase